MKITHATVGVCWLLYSVLIVIFEEKGTAKDMWIMFSVLNSTMWLVTA